MVLRRPVAARPLLWTAVSAWGFGSAASNGCDRRDRRDHDQQRDGRSATPAPLRSALLPVP
jgi:hypothetical protein